MLTSGSLFPFFESKCCSFLCPRTSPPDGNLYRTVCLVTLFRLTRLRPEALPRCSFLPASYGPSFSLACTSSPLPLFSSFLPRTPPAHRVPSQVSSPSPPLLVFSGLPCLHSTLCIIPFLAVDLAVETGTGSDCLFESASFPADTGGIFDFYVRVFPWLSACMFFSRACFSNPS